MEYHPQYLFLRNHDLFNQLNDAEINELCFISEFRKAKKNENIYSHTREINRLYILNQGRIKVAFCRDEDLEVVSEILKEGDIFGKLTFKKSENINNEFAQVLSDEALFCSFGLEDFENVLKTKPGVAFIFSQMAADKLRIINHKYSDLVFKDVRARVLNFFRLHAHYEGKWTGNTAEINMYCSHQEIANFTASARQTVSTIINNLIKEEKIIYKGRRKVIIPDIKRLEA